MPRWSLPVGAALTVTSALLDSGRFAASLIAALIVAGAVRVDPGSGTPLFAPLKKLGDWSYALYLCHVPVILLVYQLMPPAVNTKALWALSIAVAVAVGAALGSLDVRLYRWAKAMVDRSRATPLRLAVGAYLIMFTTVAAFSSVHVLRSSDARRRNGHSSHAWGQIPFAI